MPQLPIIIPIVIIGILVGSWQKSGKKSSGKKIALWALVAGLLNAANAYAVYLLTPAPTTTFRGFTGGASTNAFTFARGASEIPFITSSFIFGFLIVAAVFAIAAVYGRVRKSDSESVEESEQEDTEELSKLKTG